MAMRRTLIVFAPFIFGVVAVTSFLQASADPNDDAITFLDQRDQLVRQIAGFVLQNYDDREALVATCGLSSNCSRRVCQPLKSDEFTCHSIPNNPDCIGPNGDVCKSTQFSWRQSFINWSNDSNIGNPTCDMRTTICSQRLLDSQIFTTSDLINSSGWIYTGSTFFQSTNGLGRSYPGKEWSSGGCNKFQARSRPWYVGSTALKKDVVLLVDYGRSMIDPSSLDQSNGFTIFSAVQITVLRFLDTLTLGDRVSIMTLADTVNVVQNLTTPLSTARSLDDPTFVGIKTRVQGLPAPNVISQAANVTLGLNQAARLFDNPNQLKIVILITSGQVEGGYVDEDLVANLKSKKVVPFIFRVLSSSQNDIQTGVLHNLSRTLGGAYEEALYEDQNPLANLDRYYSYVAWLRFVQDGKRPYWMQKYLSFSRTTNTSSVVFPAFSNKILIGLVVVEVLVDSLGGLTLSVDGALSTRNILQYLELNSSTDVSIPPSETTVLNTSTNSCPFKITNVTGICVNLDLKTNVMDLLCCKNFCPWGTSHGLPEWKIAVVVLASLLALITLVLFIIILRLICSRKRVLIQIPKPVVTPHDGGDKYDLYNREQ